MYNPLTRCQWKRRGSVLPTAIILGVLAAVSATWMIGNMIDQQRLNTRRRDVARSYFAAEAGIAQVIHWGNFPEEYDAGGVEGLFYRDITYPDTTALGAFPNLAIALADAGEDGVSIPSDQMSAFFSKYDEDHAVSNIQSITLFPRADGDPDSLLRVRSVGRTPSGRTRTVESFLAANPLLTTEIALPAALISYSTAGMGGSPKVHWGEAWSQNEFELPSKNALAYLESDPWARYRSEGQIHFPSSWGGLIGTGTDYTKPLYDVTDPTRNYPGDPSVTDGTYSGADPNSSDDDAFQHFLPPGSLPFPDFLGQYGEFKQRAREHGRYYTTDASGAIYKDGVMVDFTDEFGRPDLGGAAPYDLVFIDTTDGNPPRYPGTPEYEAQGPNLATIKPKNGKAIRGVFYICANFDATSVSGLGLNGAEDPDGTPQNLTKTYLDGVLYAAGTVSMGGNTGVYGSVLAQRGYVGSGTPDIYYNHRLKDGLEMPRGNVGSIFKIVRQRNY